MKSVQFIRSNLWRTQILLIAARDIVDTNGYKKQRSWMEKTPWIQMASLVKNADDLVCLPFGIGPSDWRTKAQWFDFPAVKGAFFWLETKTHKTPVIPLNKKNQKNSQQSQDVQRCRAPIGLAKIPDVSPVGDSPASPLRTLVGWMIPSHGGV